MTDAPKPAPEELAEFEELLAREPDMTALRAVAEAENRAFAEVFAELRARVAEHRQGDAE